MTRGKNRWTKSELPPADPDPYGPLICPCCGEPWRGPARGTAAKAKLIEAASGVPASPAAPHPDCTAPDCDCEPGIECAARGAARGVDLPDGAQR